LQPKRNDLECEARDDIKVPFCVTIQKYYRGHLGRRVVSLWRNEYQNIQVWRALCHSCAVTITRYWRGYASRKMAAFCRGKIVEYLLKLRKAEAKEDEDEFFNDLKFYKHERCFGSYSSDSSAPRLQYY
jgi:IQ calmodulin-binding motif.